MASPLSIRDQHGLEMHLNVRPPDDPDVHSMFWALVRDARQVARRDPESGTCLEDPEDHPGLNLWPASLLYMVLTDQIGNSLEPLNGAALAPETSGFKRALYHFGRRVETLSDLDIDTLWALRCSFAHDYSLINLPSNPGQRARYARLFALTWSVGRPLLEHPLTPWDGDLIKLPSDRTQVNLRAFEELGERIINELQILCSKHELVLASGLDEKTFTRRYTVRVTS